MITVKELREALQGMPDDLLVMVPCDPEGNGYHAAYGPSIKYFLKKERYQTESVWELKDLEDEEMDMNEYEKRVLL